NSLTGIYGNGLKAFLFLMVLCTVWIPVATAQPVPNSIQQQFNDYNELLEQNNFSDSIVGYESIVGSGFESGPLYLNMGIAATRMDSLGLAKYYYLKARNFDEVRLAANDALDFVNYELGRRGARLPELAWTRITHFLFFEMNHIGYVVLGLILINLGVIFYVIHWLRDYLKQINRYIGIALFVTGFIVMSGAIVIYSYSSSYSEGVQIQREVQVRNQPTMDAEIIQTGYEGFRYIIDMKSSGDSEGWYYVRMSNGSRGWIETNHLKIL
ncbi:MAG TPA: hypothetical protein DCE78_03990, partial [Bacteroidetes bacterium]|nr:hypothetical protein [Bacteroidota bacterium]